MTDGCARGFGAALLTTIAVGVSPASALPTMIRLGYSDCAACHLSPQGGNLLNTYGRGIDQAQSRPGGEYAPSTNDLVKTLMLDGRITQDVRAVLQMRGTWAPEGSRPPLFRPRLMYRNVTTLSDTLRVSATVTAESESEPRPALSYDPVAGPSSLFVNTALLHYRASPTVEFAAGRDQLPSGVNEPDLELFIKSRNRLGYYDAPLQAKMFWNAKRFHVTPVWYGGGGSGQPGERESGGGTLAEVDLLGSRRTIVGVSLLRGTADNGGRRTVGAYARLGFGAWGILAEHDVTQRTREVPLSAAFQQRANGSSTRSRSPVADATSHSRAAQNTCAKLAEQLTAGRLELMARLSTHVTVGLSARLQRDALAGRYTQSLALQGAFTTVQ